MSYPDTAAAYVIAGDLLAPQRLTPRAAADLLPLAEWSESRRRHMTPQTVAANHALHVRSSAAWLRETIAAHERAALANGREDADDMTDERERVAGMEVADAARALLAAIGEGEE